jgi:hypothetical protein
VVQHDAIGLRHHHQHKKWPHGVGEGGMACTTSERSREATRGRHTPRAGQKPPEHGEIEASAAPRTVRHGNRGHRRPRPQSTEGVPSE